MSPFLKKGSGKMTLIEAINRIDNLKQNGYSREEKIGWLSTLDGIIKEQIIDTHEGGEGIEFSGYDETTPLDTRLIVPAPYDEMYIFYLESKIDYANNEIARYNNSNAMFTSAYSEFQRAYNRTHMHKKTKIKFF